MYTKKVLGALILLAIIVPIVLVSLTGVYSIEPTGTNYTHIKTEQAPADYPSNHSAYAGNVTELDFVGFSRTQSWQGYYGNVSGTVFLADNQDNMMYNWSLADPSGEVYASRNATLNWFLVQCFNFTATGTYTDDSNQNGSTSLYGMNLSVIEAIYHINNSLGNDVDGVNETFSLTGTHESGDGYVHNPFYTNNLEFANGECLSTTLYSDGGVEDNNFQEVMLYEPAAREVVFVSLLDQDEYNPLGFDEEPHDFEMMVLENGHGTDRLTTTYYFYVELE